MGLQQILIPYKDTAWPHYFLCNYLPVSAGQDTLSLSLLNFKRSRQPDLAAWIDCSLEMLPPSLFLPGTIIVRALHHQETEITDRKPAALDQLGLALASHFRSNYLPRLLSKSQPAREIKWFSKGQREIELLGLYQVNHSLMPPLINPTRPESDSSSSATSFLIIDDILTTGTTIKMIIGALNQHFPSSKYSVFTLAKADYDDNLNKSTPLKGQNYQLEQGTGWMVAEDQAEYAYPHLLKNRIRANSFPH
jgi:hypothetical protein